MKIDDVIPIEVKDLDISKFFKDKKVVIQIRHYTYGEKMKLAQLLASDDPGKVNTQNLEKVVYYELMCGVVKKTCPFERWDEEFIKELDKRNPQLVEYIHNAVREFNLPLAEMNAGK